MKKYILIIIIILLIILSFISRITFTETNGVLTDSFNNGIPGAEIGITYHCAIPMGLVDSGTKFLGTESTKTDSAGTFGFEKKTFLFQNIFLSQCEKVITANKNGYAYYRDLCLDTGECNSIETICHNDNNVSLKLFQTNEAKNTTDAQLRIPRPCSFR